MQHCPEAHHGGFKSGAGWCWLIAAFKGLQEEFCTAPARTPTAVLLHSAIFHRGTRPLGWPRVRTPPTFSTDGSTLPRRPMIKLIFHRTCAPTQPTWDHRAGFADGVGAAGLTAKQLAAAGCSMEKDLGPAIAATWRWLLGRPANARIPSHDGSMKGDTAASQASSMLKRRTGLLMAPQADGDEAKRVGAAYAVAELAASRASDGAGRSAARSLTQVLESGSEAGKRAAVQALAAAGEAAVSLLVERMWALAAAVGAPLRGEQGGEEEAADEQGQAGHGEPGMATLSSCFEAISNAATALGEAAANLPANQIATAAAAAESLIFGCTAIRRCVAAQSLDMFAPLNPFAPSTFGPGGALACCIVALDHIGQRAAATVVATAPHSLEPDRQGESCRLCVRLVEALLPLCTSGCGDLERGERDAGRAMSVRGCVLATEALRNLSMLGPSLCKMCPSLAPALDEVSSSLTTSWRLRGAALEALARLTNCATASILQPGAAHHDVEGQDNVRQIAAALASKLVDGRFVTDGTGMIDH